MYVFMYTLHGHSLSVNFDCETSWEVGAGDPPCQGCRLEAGGPSGYAPSQPVIQRHSASRWSTMSLPAVRSEGMTAKV
jgi:hypothetical protein